MLQEENFDAALEYSKRALQADPESFAAYELAGNASLGKQDNAAAGKAYAQAWERRQSSRLALRLSSALAVAGNYAEAAGYLEEWLGQHDGDVRAREFLGTMYQHQGKDSKAVAAYEMVLRHESGNPVALNNLAWMYVTDNNPRALELARRAYQADPVNAGIKDTYGWVLVQSGQAEPGLELLAEAMDALPDVPDVRYHYAVALLQSGQQAEGRQRLRELVDGGLPFEGRAAAERLMDEK
jgi:tetratricopeptide (TPR) repeat protein